MGNTQTGDKHHKTGKSPAKGKHFIRNLNRKSSGKESKKHGRNKTVGKRETCDKEVDKTSESDNNDAIEASDNDTVEYFKTSALEVGRARTSVHSEVTVARCERRSPTRDQLPASAASPADPSSSDSVFTDPLTPLAVELNQCYYSAESASSSAHEELPRTVTPPREDAPAQLTSHTAQTITDMPHDGTSTSLSTRDTMEKEVKSDVFVDISDRDNSEKVMGAILTKSKDESLVKELEYSHDLLENRLKACPGQTSFTISRHRKVELPPVAAESSLNIIDNGNNTI